MMNNGIKDTLGRFVRHEAAPGILLILAMLAALVAANTGAAALYSRLLETTLSVGVGASELEKPLLLWINDGLMAIFFLFVGLELKREVLYGELSDRRKVILPLFAALGGIAVPSAIYAYINWGNDVAMKGWAIPAATDIAFALGILAILGSRVPVVLKVLLASVAVLDDLAAIAIIAVFYTKELSMLSLGIAALMLLGLLILNRFRVRAAAPYLLLGAVLWFAVLKSGVHATLAGVALAAFIPAGGPKREGEHGLLERMEHGLHPWVVFAILPVFAFANAGVPLVGLGSEAFLGSVPLGIMLGLFFGKPLGVFFASWLAVRLGVARLPSGVGWWHLLGVGMLCGIGFTMSLFIGSLAFETSGGAANIVEDRVGILAGSFLSALAGVAVLLAAHRWATAGKKTGDGMLAGPVSFFAGFGERRLRLVKSAGAAVGLVFLVGTLTAARDFVEEDYEEPTSPQMEPIEAPWMTVPGTMVAGMEEGRSLETSNRGIIRKEK